MYDKIKDHTVHHSTCLLGNSAAGSTACSLYWLEINRPAFHDNETAAICKRDDGGGEDPEPRRIQ